MRQKNVCIVIIKDYTSLYNVGKLNIITRTIVSIDAYKREERFC